MLNNSLKTRCAMKEIEKHDVFIDNYSGKNILVIIYKIMREHEHLLCAVFFNNKICMICNYPLDAIGTYFRCFAPRYS